MDVSLREQSATPDISVIIPVYNRVRLLKNSLGCLQKQTFPGRAEIILVDDASAEDVPAVINSCWPKDKEPPIYIRHSHNQGAAGARNTGLDAARGEYVAFVDHDDEIHPDYLSKLYQTAKEKNADYVACGVLQRTADGKQRIYADRSVDIVGGKTVMTVMTDFQLNIATWGSIVKRELIESHHIRFTKGEFEDILFFFQVGCYCRHYIAISDKIYIQCLEPNSLTQTTKDNKNYSYFQGLPKILPKVKDMIAKLGAELPFVTANERRIYIFSCGCPY